MFRTLFLALLLISFCSEAGAVFEFKSKICASGANCTDEDYNALSTWENVMDDSDGAVNLTDASMKCGNWTSLSGSNIADHANVTWDGGSSTGQLMHMTNRTGATAYYLEVLTGSLADGDVVTDGTNSFTISGAPDSCRLTAEIYDDDGDIVDNFTISGFTDGASNYITITAPEGERHNGTDNGKSTIKGASGTYNQFDIGGSWTRVNNLIFECTQTGEKWNAFCLQLQGGNYSNIVFENNIVTRSGSCSSENSRCSGLWVNGGAWDVRKLKVINNIVYGHTGGVLACGIQDSKNAVHYNNTVYGNTVGICVLESNAYLVNNLSYANSSNAFTGTPYSTTYNNLSDTLDFAVGATFTTGTSNGTSSGKLINSGDAFITDGVKVGSIVKNTTDTTYAYVTAVDSQTQLSLSADIFASGENYSVYKNYYSNSISFSNTSAKDFHLASTDTDAIDKGVDLSSIFTTDIDGTTRTGTWDIGADEYVSGVMPSYPSTLNDSFWNDTYFN